MKRIPYLIVVPILVISLYWFFYYFNSQFKKDEKIIVITEKDKKTSIDIEEYIIGVVACEMPALYEDEALKAQSIASRTYAMNMLESDRNLVLKDTSDQCYIDTKEMQEKWGSKYQQYYEKIKNIVMSTKNIVMKKENKLFKSFYFSTSNGYTQDSISVFKEGNIKSVESSWDKDSNNYTKTVEFTTNELKNLIGNFQQINIVKRDSTNHVIEVKVDDKTYSGIEFRKLLNLRSTDFQIKYENSKYYITTYGYGHGVGMSQYGANYLAKNNKTYEEILKYYYNDISLEIY